MSEQATDLRRATASIRRHKFFVGLFLVLGVLSGGAYALLAPPAYVGTALVVLPDDPVVMENEATEAVIATSDPVLSLAQPSISPAMSLGDLKNAITVGTQTPTVLSITAKTKKAADAVSAANAVAKAFVTYVGTANGPAGNVQAAVLQQAITATRGSVTVSFVLDLLIGTAAGALIAVLLVLGRDRGDRRLRERDAIADSIGVPVLAAVPASRLRDAADWTELLQEYRPEPVYAWRLRKALQALGLLGPGGGAEHNAPVAVTVLSLAGDGAALALGPQLASYAASLGIPTALVVGPQEDDATTATLRVAARALATQPREKSAPLQVITSPEELRDWQRDSVLAVVVSVVDSQSPRLRFIVRPTVAVIAVSAGEAGAAQLARVAMSSAETGHDIVGILVANPDPADTTTGQVPHLTRPVQRLAPTRLTGNVTEIRR